MTYTRNTWINGSAPYLNATNLNNIETALVDIDARLAALELSHGTAPPPTNPTLYGSAYNFDSLANLQCGGASNATVAHRFRAETSSTLTNVRLYWQGGGGYGAGTGGTIRISVQADVAGIPSGTNLAYVDAVNPTSNAGSIYTFSSPATLAEGTLYHIVYTNIDASPTANYISVNHTWVRGAVLSPRQPKWLDSDYAVLRKSPTEPAWTVQGQYTSIIDLTYGDATHQGQGYMEVDAANPTVVTSTTSMIRQKFVMDVTGDAVGAGVRLAKYTGSASEDVTVGLYSSDGTTLLDSFTASTAALPLGPYDTGIGSWVSGDFTTAPTLSSGSTYYLRVSTGSSTTLWQRAIRRGSSYSYNAATYFNNSGHAQVTTNSGSSWGTVGSYGTTADLQCYLELAT